MSEYRTAEIQTMLKSEVKGVRNSDRSDFRHSGLLELHLGTTPEIQTDHLTIIQHLNAIINALQVDRRFGI